jgi:hypothetical protein
MEQKNLFDEDILEPLNPVQYDPELTLKERFVHFHQANPHVYREIKRRSLILHDQGIRRFGIKAIFEAMRFDHAVRTGGDSYKMNNNHAPFYARLVMKTTPVLEGFFQIREQTSEGAKEELSIRIDPPSFQEHYGHPEIR